MSSPELGARVGPDGTSFAVRAPTAEAVWLCLFHDETERRVPMARDGAIWRADVPGVGEGTRYGYRAGGPPPHDVAKLLVDPHATTLDRAFSYDMRLGERGVDTAVLVPKAVMTAPSLVTPLRPVFRHGRLIYEVNVRGFTMLHPDVPKVIRGTIAALAHPAVIGHLTKLGVDAVELMPIVAWIDERHLPPLGLRNAWGYNPVVPMALDPRLAPGGVAELRDTVATLRAHGIGVILDLVFNHTGESDEHGPTLSLRGLDDAVYARDGEGRLINDAGTGNTLDFANPAVRDLTLASMRHFVATCGVDGFRFDLATVMARGPGFDTHAPIFADIAADPLLADRVLIAEPWDTGPGGYQLGAFPPDWLEWNDRFRDDVRRFWRGDGSNGTLATRLSGSSEVFGDRATCSVNFIAAHDGFTLADTVAYAERHNHANGEHNRDGHAHEVSWNNGAEGSCDDASVIERRHADQRALLATLFASRGTIMLTAGDEFGRSQRGNNNAYAQDNATTWLDWHGRDRQLEDYVADLSRQRRAAAAISDPAMRHDARWHRHDGGEMTQGDWDSSAGFAMTVGEVRLLVDRDARSVTLETV
ncbi:glycogen debranching protein GlgX [Sphingomonas sp. RHCKR47]|uniref:glycogen debranching protein GlgX n=1 Tax=Sphingomonas citricola TaxID=2862498 RepID=UPI001CA4B7F5|nr:glycogen debranching protein GlgX [Sphingomonas citricola]MBW6522619.1 glycogen debranching protein GlgX [Sphingomonas citricola]